MRSAQQRVDAVGADDEIGLAKLGKIGDDALIARLDTDRADARLKDFQEFQPAERGKADAVDADALAAMRHGDVGPRFEMQRERRQGRGIVRVEKLERAVGEHDAEPEGGVGAVLLEDRNAGIGTAALDEITEIESRRPGAEDRDAHGRLRN